MIKLQKSTLEAALLTAAVNDIRYYRNGVAINRGALVSTNGASIFVAEIDAPDDAEAFIVEFNDELNCKPYIMPMRE